MPEAPIDIWHIKRLIKVNIQISFCCVLRAVAKGKQLSVGGERVRLCALICACIYVCVFDSVLLIKTESVIALEMCRLKNGLCSKRIHKWYAGSRRTVGEVEGGAYRQANEPLTVMLADAAVCAPAEHHVQSTPAQHDGVVLPPVETC